VITRIFGEVVQESESVHAEQFGKAESGAGGGIGEARKVDLAGELRSQTTLPLAWIADRLNLGTRGHLAWLLPQRGKSRLAPTNQRLLRI